MYIDPALNLGLHCPHVAALLITSYLALCFFAMAVVCDYFDGSTKALISHMTQKLKQLIQLQDIAIS